ncbi:MAG: hypothetical protein HC866_00460 [Leptolyngbyaceae cyanobacterium RU_5_1]|nr:hypothetical protein [Leptolyngbyaceae cyanobacterium RU_5_1]
MQRSLVTQQAEHPTTHTATHLTDPALICVGFLIALPIAISLGALSFKQYRANTRRRRIEKLERLWNLDLERK